MSHLCPFVLEPINHLTFFREKNSLCAQQLEVGNVNPNAPNYRQLSLWNQIRGHLSSCAINHSPHGRKPGLRSPPPRAVMTPTKQVLNRWWHSTPQRLSQSLGQEFEILFFISRANTCQKWQVGLKKFTGVKEGDWFRGGNSAKKNTKKKKKHNKKLKEHLILLMHD